MRKGERTGSGCTFFSEIKKNCKARPYLKLSARQHITMLQRTASRAASRLLPTVGVAVPAVLAATSASSASLSASASGSSSKPFQKRRLATVADGAASAVLASSKTHAYKVVVVGGGAAGQAVSHQLAQSGVFEANDILLIDPAEHHDYQPGWTLVGAGLKNKEELRRPMSELVEGGAVHLKDAVETFEPEKNQLQTREGRTIQYSQLVVAPGIHINWDGIEGLLDALQNSDQSRVASIYSYETCSKVYPLFTSLSKGKAVFTQPAGVIKCAGAPQKMMWLALDHWKKQGHFSPTDPSKGVQVSFITGMPTMFSAPKYSAILDDMRKDREVEGLFAHNLTKIDAQHKVATFARGNDQKPLEVEYDFLHATPPMGPLSWIKSSPLAASDSGFVDVDQGTLQHEKYDNVWSLGDSSSLPTSKTAAAISAEAPVLVANLLQSVVTGSARASEPAAVYDGYTSCPLLTEYGKVLLAEFKYGGVPKETFANMLGIDQGVPRKAFYHLKKDFFPWVYYNSFVKGTWQGPKGLLNPRSLTPRAFHSSARPSSIASRSTARSFSTSAVSLRNTPARRPRDPLEKDPSAVRHRLPSGETFIVRPPPSAPSPHTSTLVPNPILDGASAIAASEQKLPPALKPRSRGVAPINASPLTQDQILQIQALRQADPVRNTATALARQFKCSAAFVRIIAPAPNEVKEQRAEESAEQRKTWSLRRPVVAAERAERRKLW